MKCFTIVMGNHFCLDPDENTKFNDLHRDVFNYG